MYNDLMFIDAFLTPEFCIEQKLFVFEYNDHTNFYEIYEREFKAVKEKLLHSLTNFGQPFIYVENANFLNRGELQLLHDFDGVELNRNEAQDTLVNLYKVWKRPVHIETVVETAKTRFSYNGKEHSEIECE